MTTTRGTAVAAAEPLPGVQRGLEAAEAASAAPEAVSGAASAEAGSAADAGSAGAAEAVSGDGTGPAGSAKPDLDLATRFRPIMLRLDLLVRRQNTQYSLSRAQTSILHTLACHGPLRMTDLARLENVRVPTTSNSVSVIESMGFVERVPDAADRRGVTVQLTDLGRTRIEEVLQDRDRDFADQLGRLSPEHRELLADAVPALTSLLDAFDTD